MANSLAALGQDFTFNTSSFAHLNVMAINTMPESQTIPALLVEQSEKYGEREAVVWNDHRLTYRDLHREVLHTARALMALGVKQGDHVALLMGNRPEWVISFLAAQQLGATAVALNTWATPRELQYAISHADVKYIIAVDQFRRTDYRAVFADMQPWSQAFPKLRDIIWVHSGQAEAPADDTSMSWQKLLAKASEVTQEQVEAAGSNVSPEATAMLLYTSGSTAAPKGILLQHHWWIQNAWNIGERQKVTHNDRLWLAVSLFWSFGSVNAMPNILSHGACIVLQEHFDAERALELIEAERCSIMYATPNMVQALAEHSTRPQRNLSSLRSGAMIGTPEQLMMAVRLGAKSICNVYGLSETYGNCAVIDADEPLALRLESVGKPLPGVTLRICDLENDQPLPAGQVGEIRLQGPLFSAYYKEPEKTQESYDAEGFFRTGDLGMLDEAGNLYYRGRLKEMVKSGGINIAPIEIEEMLMRHPSVQTAYVIGVPDAKLDEALAAIIVPREDANPTADELIQYCRRELAAYKVPMKFHFAKDADLPLTTTGKIMKARLRMFFEKDTA